VLARGIEDSVAELLKASRRTRRTAAKS